MENLTSYYEILNVSPQASDHDIKQAYRRLAMQYHPDRNPHNRQLYELRFHLINEAYAQLKTQEQRARYNRALRMKAQNDNEGQSSFFAQLAGIFKPAKTQREKTNS